MLLDQNLTKTDEELFKQQILEIQIKSIKTYSIFVQVTFCLLLGLYFTLNNINIDPITSLSIIGPGLFIEMFICPLLIFPVFILNIIPYKQYTYRERYWRMYWILMLLIHLVLITLIILILLTEKDLL